MKSYRFFIQLFLLALASALLLAACSSAAEPPAPTETAGEAVAAAMRQHLADQGAPVDKMEIQVEQIADGYARVAIISTDPESPGGFNGYLKLDNGNWSVVISGSGMELEHVEAAGIPESVWPEGWVLPATEPSGDPAAVSCPAPTADTLALVSDAEGYCFLYPSEYVIEHTGENNTEVVIDSIMNHIDPRVSVAVTDLDGRTLEQAVEEFLAGYDPAVFNLEPMPLTIAGEAAILIDQIPGQDLYRKLLVAHNGALYDLAFAPYDPALVDTFPQAELLYNTVVESFNFMAP